MHVGCQFCKSDAFSFGVSLDRTLGQVLQLCCSLRGVSVCFVSYFEVRLRLLRLRWLSLIFFSGSEFSGSEFISRHLWSFRACVGGYPPLGQWGQGVAFWLGSLWCFQEWDYWLWPHVGPLSWHVNGQFTSTKLLRDKKKKFCYPSLTFWKEDTFIILLSA